MLFADCCRLIDLALCIEQVHWVKQALDLVLDPVNVFTQFNIVSLVLQHPYGMFARDGSTQFQGLGKHFVQDDIDTFRHFLGILGPGNGWVQVAADA